MIERRSPDAPISPHPDPPRARPATHRPARARWRDDSGPVDLSIEQGRGLVVVPLASRGAERATMLLEALDRAAGGGQRRVQICRGDMTLEMDFPAGWPEASRVPSMVIGEGTRFAPPADVRVPDRLSLESVALRADALEPRDRDVVREYPLRRRGLAARRRHVEADLVAADEAERRRARYGSAVLAAGGLALLLAVAGAVTGSVALLLPASAAFFAAGIAFVLLRAAGRRAADRRYRLEARLAGVADLERELDAAAGGLAARLGCRDPWEAADRLRLATRAVPVPRRASAEGVDLLEIAHRIVRAAGRDPDALDWTTGLDDVRRAGGRGWPAEVSAGCDALFAAPNLLRVADLVCRVDTVLAPDWPLVLHEPWPEHDATERASLLLAVAEVARPRPVVALVAGRDSAD